MLQPFKVHGSNNKLSFAVTFSVEGALVAHDISRAKHSTVLGLYDLNEFLTPQVFVWPLNLYLNLNDNYENEYEMNVVIKAVLMRVIPPHFSLTTHAGSRLCTFFLVL